MKQQIQALKELKTKYSADNYTETFAPVVNKALESAQQVIEEYKQSVLDPLKQEYQNTLASLNSTKEQLEQANSQLKLKQSELETTQNSLKEVQRDLDQNKKTWETTQESLKTAQAQLSTLNEEVANNQKQAQQTYDSVKKCMKTSNSKHKHYLVKWTKIQTLTNWVIN
ncbi:hypothetical protein [Mycoplasma sp. 3686d]|uniref:hypothetical protein n=1 Tax=Mycoplasma sp. 3686d TaxID=2967300 RepID=UPI00211CA20B|nr:hypothetical protein [Mycoplasma sp. 3686d]UUM24559.1 hypothetical protein NPA12_02555 [Mycoplasma sp. 3686d]